MARGPRKRPRAALVRKNEEEVDYPDNLPSEGQRKIIIELGVAVLLVAFLTTSGITLVNLNSNSRAAAANETAPQETELDRWRKEAQKNPTDPSAQANLAYYLLGQAEEAGGNTTEAAPAFTEANAALDSALKIDKDYPFALRLKGQMNVIQGHFGEGEKFYQQALAASSRPVPATDKDADSKTANLKAEQVEDHIGLAISEAQQKKTDAAMKELDEALKIDPGAPHVYEVRSMLYSQQGQKELARKDLQTLANIAQHTNNLEMAQMAQARLYMMDRMEPTPAVVPAAASTAKPTGSPTPIQILPEPITAPTGTATPQAAVTPAPTATP